MDKKKKVGLAVLIIIALYVAASIFFQYHYFIGTKVNGIHDLTSQYNYL